MNILIKFEVIHISQKDHVVMKSKVVTDFDNIFGSLMCTFNALFLYRHMQICSLISLLVHMRPHI